jgi:hypothetical protein
MKALPGDTSAPLENWTPPMRGLEVGEVDDVFMEPDTPGSLLVVRILGSKVISRPF